MPRKAIPIITGFQNCSEIVTVIFVEKKLNEDTQMHVQLQIFSCSTLQKIVCKMVLQLVTILVKEVHFRDESGKHSQENY